MKFVVGSEASIDLNPALINQIIMGREEKAAVTPRRLITVEDIVNLGEKNDQSTSSSSNYNGGSDKTTPSRCWYCKSCRLRVVQVENTNRRILECANLRCLATIGYTHLPVGTIIEHEKASKKNYGWYLRDTAEMVYPTQRTLALFSKPKFEYIPEVLYDSAKRVVIRCPGQQRLVPLE